MRLYVHSPLLLLLLLLLCFNGGWERHTSKRHKAHFLHNPATGESKWYMGWVELKSRWYGRTYLFQPTTGRAEWELPSDPANSVERPEAHQLPVADATATDSAHSGEHSVDQQQSVDRDLAQTKEKVQSWKAKIMAAKAKANADIVVVGSEMGEAAHGETPRKRRRDQSLDGAFPSDMGVDRDVAKKVELLDQDVPSVALRRERLRIECLDHFAKENLRYGNMAGYSKTSRSCRSEGMTIGLGGMFGR